MPPPEGHPFPRVVVDAKAASGGHGVYEVQSVLRSKLWMGIVDCAGGQTLGAHGPRGKVVVAFGVSRDGKVSGVRVTKSTLADRTVAGCIARRLGALTFPRASSVASARAEIQIAPGDEPLSAPSVAVFSGRSHLSVEALRGPILAALPELEACARAARTYAPALWGRLAVRLHVTARGTVDEAHEVESRFPDERVVRCALQALRALTFPASDGDLRAVTPLRFLPPP